MPEPKFVEAVSKSTGGKQFIPASWLGKERPPFNDFELPSSTPKTATPPPVPPAETTPALPVSKKESK